ncbi:MAG: copper resistance protein B [Polymorphobacter sp.]|uniref:copper resistance protein B n=1 Tax=Polymorphobacter sp. TaxID=1909290 RepID=UPI003A8B5626
MRMLAMGAALLLGAPALAADPMHGGQTFHYAEVEGDYARVGGTDLLNWEGQGWIGTDMDKFWVKTEGELSDGALERAEVQFLYGHTLWQFFDLQAGVRVDAEPDRRGYLALGVQGLAPYLLDTQAHVFLGEKGDVHLRFRQLFNLLITNRLIVSPLVETDFYLTDAPERGVGAGFSRIETGVQTRYEIRRKFAPYLAAVYDRKLGETARIAQANGEDVGGWSLRAGLRLWF